MPSTTDNNIAKLSDIKDLLQIQISRSLHNSAQNGLVEDKIMRHGFLVHTLSEEEIKFLINKEGVYFLVRRNEDTVVGYALGYNLKIWKELNPDWFESVKFIDDRNIEDLSDNLTMYFRHVATIPSDDHATGLKLSRELFQLAKNLNYKNVLGEILKEPYFNSPSYKIHTRLGAIDIGEIEEVYNEVKYKWILLQKELR
jgi:hypothetical protein